MQKQVRIENDVAKKLRLEAAKNDLTVPAMLDKLLYPIFYGKARRLPVK